MIRFAFIGAAFVSWVLRVFFHRGGETWPGELLLRIYPRCTLDIARLFKEIIYVVGTNGKTTTTASLVSQLQKAGKQIITNASGANQLNGIVSSIFTNVKPNIKNYFGVFEVDEFSLSEIISKIPPTRIVMLNVVRDQLDRYGEVHAVLHSWKKAIEQTDQTSIIANASDPGLVYLLKSIKSNKISWFSIPKSLLSTSGFVAGDSVYCMNCSSKLEYEGIYVSHLGQWHCKKCSNVMPKKTYTFPTRYERNLKTMPSYVYCNLQAVHCILEDLGISNDIDELLSSWKPAFGRNETLKIGDREYTFILGKNPASWSVAVADLFRKNTFTDEDAIMFGLNNRVPDGHDVSWIWDIELPEIKKTMPILFAFGDRAYDMAVRLDEAGQKVTVIEDIRKVQSNRVFIVANYSALLEIRKEVTGRAIL